MPQRFLRPGIRTSERFNSVSRNAQFLYLAILTLVDDYGRYDGRPAVLHGEAFAVWNDLNPNLAVNPQETAALCCELSSSKLAEFYESEGKKYLQLTQWKERARGESKFPDPKNCVPQESAGIRSGKTLPSPSPSPLASVRAAADCSGCGISWNEALKWLDKVKENGADYSEKETKSAWLALNANGWMWGRNPVTDYRSAIERQIQTDRERNTKYGNTNGKINSLNPAADRRNAGQIGKGTDWGAVSRRRKEEAAARLAGETDGNGTAPSPA